MGSFEVIQVLFQNGILDLIHHMLIEEANNIIPLKGMQIIEELMISLEDEESKREINIFLMTRKGL